MMPTTLRLAVGANRTSFIWPSSPSTMAADATDCVTHPEGQVGAVGGRPGVGVHGPAQRDDLHLLIGCSPVKTCRRLYVKVRIRSTALRRDGCLSTCAERPQRWLSLGKGRPSI